MLECIQSLGALYKKAKLDYEYEFYNTYLKDYVEQENEMGLVKASDSLQENFMGLSGSYSVAKSVIESERSMEDKLADSFMFYVSIGVIILLEDGYYINTNRLLETTKQLKFASEQNGRSFKKGGIK